MSLVKMNRRKFPWLNDGFTSLFDTNDFLSDDFFIQEKNVPAMNVKENKNNFEVELALPGFSKNEIEVILEDDLLKVRAQKSNEKEVVEENYTRKEFSYNEFERKFKLPATVDSKEKVKAHYENGILNLNLVKKGSG